MISLPRYCTSDTVGSTLKNTAARYPDKVALICSKDNISYKTFNEEANRFANAIMKLGLVRGDKAILMSTNSIEYLYIWYGLAKAGITMVPMNLMLKEKDVIFIANHSEAKAFIVQDKFYNLVKHIMPEMKSVAQYIYLDSKGDNVTPSEIINFKHLMDSEKSTADPLVDVDMDDVAQMPYTSGTESTPKGVMLTHRNLISVYVSSIVSGDKRKDDIFTAWMPFFHAAQANSHNGAHIYVGGTTFITDFDPVKVLEAIQREKITHMIALPSQYRALLNVPNFEKYDLSSLRMCHYSMQPVSVRELKVFMQKFNPKRGFQIYFGQTEMGPVTTVLTPEEHYIKEGSVGKAVLNVEMAVMDEDGTILSPPCSGEIVYRGSQVMKGYFKDEEKTKDAFRYGWFHSGDLVRMDKDGYIWFEDRMKDMIKTGGENVSTLEVEKCIYDFPNVQEVAVIGLPDPIWVERVTALIVCKEGETINPSDVINHCKKNLSNYKVPKQVEIVKEIPKTATGKVRKNIIRQMFTPDLKAN